MSRINAGLFTDSYKHSHYQMSPKGTEYIYSNFTPRFDGYFSDKFKTFDGGVVWFGLQYALRKILVETWKENFFDKPKDEVISDMRKTLLPYIGMEDLSHFEALHDLGYMPIIIKSLPEGSVTQVGIPMLTITNTHPDFQWIPNFLESALSTELWKPMTVATIGRTMRNLINKFAMETEGSLDNTDYQLHDFSLRGHSGVENAAACGAAFLLSSKGTDNIPAIPFIEYYYDSPYSDTFNIANSVPAGEHSVTTLGIQMYVNDIESRTSHTPEEALLLAETKYARDIMHKFPTGIVSYVADSYDYFGFLDTVLPNLKAEVMARDGKFVVRGDSGNPVDIIAGIEIPDYSDLPTLEVAASRAFYNHLPEGKTTAGIIKVLFTYAGVVYKTEYEVEVDQYSRFSNAKHVTTDKHVLSTEEKGTIERLWDIFGGTVNELGYKVLDSHIGMIYGDGITEARAIDILTRLKNKGFASTNIVLGIGSYSLNMLSRDDLGTAIKATSAVINGKRLSIYKDPKTDTTKKSARGLLHVEKVGKRFLLTDDVSEEQEMTGALEVVWKDGVFFKTSTFESIINTLQENN